jgi:membrane protein DedA with SNARE-associated domain
LPKEKLSLKLIAFLAGFDGFTAYALILSVLLACGLGLPIPEDITLVSAGILAALGNISLIGAFVAGFIGVLFGDTILFFLGRTYGNRVFQLPGFRTVFTEKRVELARTKVLANSKLICFTARFLPGLRAPIYLTAGILGVRPFTFILLDGIAALISVPVWVYLGWYLGENLDHLISVVTKAQRFIVLGIVLLVLFYILIRRHFKKPSISPSESELK